MPRRATCPICGRPPMPGSPFCSQGCRDRDLLQWLGEGYRIPTAEPPDPGEDEPALDRPADRD